MTPEQILEKQKKGFKPLLSLCIIVIGISAIFNPIQTILGFFGGRILNYILTKNVRKHKSYTKNNNF